MVSTFQIKPSLLLQPYISSYALRIFNTGDFAMPKPMHAIKESYLVFFLEDRFCFVTKDSGETHNNISNSLTNLLTQSQGVAWYKGSYKLLCVQFTANGVAAIFGIPQCVLIDKVLSVEDFLGSTDNTLLTEQLASLNDISQMGLLLNSYFTKKLLQQKNKYYTNTIAHIANYISKKNGSVSIDAIAYNSNMGIRTFERRFTEQVGIPVKLYMRIARFYHAVENKMLHPEKSWTDIAHENAYYDQSHFIKDCREFSSKSPDELFTYTPLPKERFTEMDL